MPDFVPFHAQFGCVTVVVDSYTQWHAFKQAVLDIYGNNAQVMHMRRLPERFTWNARPARSHGSLDISMFSDREQPFGIGRTLDSFFHQHHLVIGQLNFRPAQRWQPFFIRVDGHRGLIKTRRDWRALKIALTHDVGGWTWIMDLESVNEVHGYQDNRGHTHSCVVYSYAAGHPGARTLASHFLRHGMEQEHASTESTVRLPAAGNAARRPTEPRGWSR